ncbi:MAG: trigger factor [Clostridia bacterium]|nr:trigger factor [Clostridia bacterium]
MAFITNLKYKGLTVKLPEVVTITEDDVLAELERFRASQAETVEITSDDVVLKNGDTACIYFCGYVNGEKFPGGEADKYDLVIGSHTFIPGFEEQMVGMKVGEERDVLVTFPEVYEPSLAGKDATFKVKLYCVKQLKEVELTDELVKKATNLESIEAFKAGYRAYMQDKLAQDYMAKKHEALLDAVVATANVEVTKDMVDAQIETMLKSLERDLTYYNMTVDQYFEMNGTTKEAETERIRDQVKVNIKKVLVVEEIMNLENLIVSDEEVEEFLKGNQAENIDKEGVKTNLSYAKVLEFLDKNNNWEK